LVRTWFVPHSYHNTILFPWIFIYSASPYWLSSWLNTTFSMNTLIKSQSNLKLWNP